MEELDQENQGDFEEILKYLFGYPAGKARMRKSLLPLIPEHNTYIEPFAGSAAIFFSKEPAKKEILNDRSAEVMGVLRAVRALSKTDLATLAKRNWVSSKALHAKLRKATPSAGIEKVYRYLYLSRSSFFTGVGGTYSAASSGANFKEGVMKRLEKSHARFHKGVKIYDGDYEAVIRKYDSPDAFIFLDPPYPGYNINVGEKEFDEDRFRKTLKNIKGKFLVTYGNKGKLDTSGFHVKKVKVYRSLVNMPGVSAERVLETLLISNFKLATGVSKATERFPDVSIKEFADPKNRKYPIDTYEHVRAAISYFSIPENAEKYSLSDQKKMWAKIKDAAEKFDIKVGPDSGPPTLEKADSDVTWELPISKIDEEERVLTGIVLEPNTVDSQGDTVSEHTIKEAAYNFLKKYNKGTKLGFMHKMFGDLGISLVESWIAKRDEKLNGKPIKKGSWIMSVQVDRNPELWERCKSGEVTGFSIGGVARVSG